jgi:hypothetical protein
VIIDYQVLIIDYECGFDYRDIGNDLSSWTFKISWLKIRKEKRKKKKKKNPNVAKITTLPQG